MKDIESLKRRKWSFFKIRNDRELRASAAGCRKTALMSCRNR